MPPACYTGLNKNKNFRLQKQKQKRAEIWTCRFQLGILVDISWSAAFYEHREPLQLNLPNKGEFSPNYFLYRGLAPLFPRQNEIDLTLLVLIYLHGQLLKPL
jgi:hypothetical protein